MTCARAAKHGDRRRFEPAHAVKADRKLSHDSKQSPGILSHVIDFKFASLVFHPLASSCLRRPATISIDSYKIRSCAAKQIATATTATMVPVLAALAPGLGVNPSLLIVPCTIAASYAFMMPVATPPNAIVFGSGFITIGQICKAGFWLNIAGVTIITVIGYSIVLPMIRF